MNGGDMAVASGFGEPVSVEIGMFCRIISALELRPAETLQAHRCVYPGSLEALVVFRGLFAIEGSCYRAGA